MAKEIENKYLAKYIPKELDKVRLYQGYIHISKEKQVRVRINTTEQIAFVCIKYMGLLERNEFEVEIEFDEAIQLYRLCDYKLEKTRYSMPGPAGVHFDFDMYDNGLKIVEVELPHLKFELDPSLFSFIGENVDGKYEYTNYNLAGFPEELYK